MTLFAFLGFSILLALATPFANAQAQTQLVGCVSHIPGGGLQLGVASPGITYSLQGDTNMLLAQVGHLVRVHGEVKAGNPAQGGEPVFTVRQIEEIANTCTSPPPAHTPVAVVGKAGEGQVAIPITTSASAGQTTPGFQTESDQEPPNSARSSPRSRWTQESAYAPSNTAQAAQTFAAADTYAEAASRSEIQPGNTLGGESYLASSGTENAEASRSIVVQLTGDATQHFAPATISIKAGTSVKWTNVSTKTHEITSNPGKGLSTTVLPAGAKPFDSGFLRPGASFTYSFKAPGVYHYFCSMNCAGNPTGEVIVQR